MSKVYLSASKINTFTQCTFAAYNTYCLGLRGGGTEATSRGLLTHYILQCLGAPRHRNKIPVILKNQNIYCFESIDRFARIWAKQLDILEEEILEEVNQFVLTALRNDFLGEGYEELKIEFPFLYEGENFKLRGFIDQLFINHTEKKVLIVDFKTSRNKIAKDSNLQGKLYELVCSKMFPGYKIEVRFNYLRMKRAVVEVYPESSEGEMEMLEDYLNHFSEFLEDFDFSKAGALLAYDNSKTRNFLCGKFLPGQLNEKGKQGHCCSWKVPQPYFSLLDKGRVVQNSLNRGELEKIRKRGQRIVEKQTEGCPAFAFLWKKD